MGVQGDNALNVRTTNNPIQSVCMGVQGDNALYVRTTNNPI